MAKTSPEILSGLLHAASGEGFPSAVVLTHYSPGCELLPLPDVERLRMHVWENRLAPNSAMQEGWIDRLDYEAHHWTVSCAGELLASARMTVHDDRAGVPDEELFTAHTLPLPLASLNRLVVSKQARGNGLSSLLDARRLQTAESLGCRCVVGVATAARVPSMSQRGWEPLGPDRADTDFLVRVTPMWIRPR